MAITSRALAFATRWFDGATVHRTFEPLIADWQREWQDAPPSRRARVTMGALAAFGCACIFSMPSVITMRAPKSVTDRVVVGMTRFIALGSLPLIYPFLAQIEHSGWRFALLVVAVVPQAMTVVFPFSIVGAVDAIRRTERLPPHVERALAVKLALLALLFMIVFGGFVVPAANQAFREGMSPRPAPVRGVRELTTWQLLTDPTLLAAHEPYTGGADRATRIQRELNNRAALALIPALLLWLRWNAAGAPRRRWWWPLPAPILTTIAIALFVVTSFLGFQLEREWDLTPGLGHWLPNFTLAIGGLMSHYWQRQFADAEQAPKHPGTQAP